MACSVLMRLPTGQRISKVRKQQKKFHFCNLILKSIGKSSIIILLEKWSQLDFCIRIHNFILYFCYCPKPITFLAENEELCVKALLSKIYWKYLSLYGIYKSKEWWQMKFLKTKIQYAFFSNTMKVRKKLHHTHNWTSVDLKVSDQSNIFHILSLTELEQSSSNKSVSLRELWMVGAQSMTGYIKCCFDMRPLDQH